MPPIVVTLPSPLRSAAGGTREVTAEGDTVGAALASLRGTHATLAHRILNDLDRPRPGVKLFLNDTDVRALAELNTPLTPGDRLAVVLPLAGG